MITFNHLILPVIVFVTIRETTGLIESTEAEDNCIIKTDSILRDITNKVFTALKLKGITEKPIARHYSLIHNYFVSLTLQDHEKLKIIAKLSRVDHTTYNDSTKNLVNTINSILDTNFNIIANSNTTNENIAKELNFTKQIVDYIDSRLKELEYLQVHNANGPRVDINKDILAVLNNEAQVINGTYGVGAIFAASGDNNDTEEKYSEFWKPDPRLSGRRIFHGKRTKIRYFPFMASIEVFNQFTCGGSILSEDLILTAASCLQLAWNNRFYRENPVFLSVRVGSNYYNTGGESIPVLELFFHPTYNPMTLSDNIVLIRLSRQLKLWKEKKKTRVKKIDFDRRDSPLPMNVDGITIVGWGSQTKRNLLTNALANKISYAILEVFPLDDCQNIYSKQYVRHTNFCAGYLTKGDGACNRDVGGPGLVSGVLTGIISFGSPTCGTPDSPTVFTKIGYYADWIEEVFETVANSPFVRQRATPKPYHPYNTLKLTQSTPRSTLRIFPVVETSSHNLHTITPYVTPPQGLRQRPLDKQATPPKKEFNQFIKTMFDTDEIEEYLDYNSHKETGMKKPKVVKALQKKIHQENDSLTNSFVPMKMSHNQNNLNNNVKLNQKIMYHNILTTKESSNQPVAKHLLASKGGDGHIRNNNQEAGHYYINNNKQERGEEYMNNIKQQVGHEYINKQKQERGEEYINHNKQQGGHEYINNKKQQGDHEYINNQKQERDGENTSNKNQERGDEYINIKKHEGRDEYIKYNKQEVRNQYINNKKQDRGHEYINDNKQQGGQEYLNNKKQISDEKRDIPVTKLDYSEKHTSKEALQVLHPKENIRYTFMGSASKEITDRFNRYTDFTRKTKIPLRHPSIYVEPRSKHKLRAQDIDEINLQTNYEDGDKSIKGTQVENFDISNDKYTEGTEGESLRHDTDIFYDDNEGIKAFSENDLINTGEQEISMEDDNEKPSPPKIIDELFNDDVLGDKFVSDDSKKIEKIADNVSEIKFDESDKEKSENQEDYEDGILLPEDLADLTFRKNRNGTFGELSEKVIFDILADFIAAQTQNLTVI